MVEHQFTRPPPKPCPRWITAGLRTAIRARIWAKICSPVHSSLNKARLLLAKVRVHPPAQLLLMSVPFCQFSRGLLMEMLMKELSSSQFISLSVLSYYCGFLCVLHVFLCLMRMFFLSFNMLLNAYAFCARHLLLCVTITWGHGRLVFILLLSSVPTWIARPYSEILHLFLHHNATGNER